MPPFNVNSFGRSVLKHSPLEGMFVDCTHIIVSLLKTWNVAVVRTEYDYAVFPCHFKKVHTWMKK